MGLSKAVALCLTFVVVVNAQGSIFGDLAAKENQLNCLLGRPNCVSPPPPPTGASPPPPAASPPLTPPGASPPGTTPGSSPPGSTPGSSPGSSPSLAPGPAPGPSATGNAVAVVSLSFPDGFVVTDQVRNTLTNLIQQQLGTNAVVQLQIGAGRKLLAESTLTLLISNAVDCQLIASILERIFGDGSFVRAAQAAGIPLQAAALNGFACTKPGEAPVVVTGPPATAPGLTPAGGPGSPVTPTIPTGAPTGTPPTGSPVGVPPVGVPPVGVPPIGVPTPGPGLFFGR